MAEWNPQAEDLDVLIESALRDEPLSPVPLDLHARISQRIRLAALEQHERVRFRNTLLSGLAGGIAVIGVCGVLVAVTSFQLYLDHGISGGLGIWDYYRNYYAAAFEAFWRGRLDGLVLTICLTLGVFTIGVGLRPLWRERVYHVFQSIRSQGQSLRAR